MRSNKPLAELHEGECARVTELLVQNGMRRRLLDIGLTPGTRVECELKSVRRPGSLPHPGRADRPAAQGRRVGADGNGIKERTVL